jgi:hypothetical protein
MWAPDGAGRCGHAGGPQCAHARPIAVPCRSRRRTPGHVAAGHYVALVVARAATSGASLLGDDADEAEVYRLVELGRVGPSDSARRSDARVFSMNSAGAPQLSDERVHGHRPFVQFVPAPATGRGRSVVSLDSDHAMSVPNDPDEGIVVTPTPMSVRCRSGRGRPSIGG